MAAVTRAPPEILSMIFDQTVLMWRSEEIEPCWPRLWADLHAINLVCRSWRHAAVGNPFIWTNVWHGDLADANIDRSLAGVVVSKTKYRGKSPYYNFRTCLERSISVFPLHIYAAGIGYLLDMIPHIEELGAFNRVVDLHVGSDEELKVHLYEPLLNAPTFPQLEHLSLALSSSLSSEVFVAWLTQYTMVQSMNISVTWFSTDPVPPLLEFPDLKRLEVLQQDWPDLVFLSDLIEAPELEYLAVYRLMEPGDGVMEPLLFGAGDALLEFVYGGGCVTNDIVNVLNNAPNVHTLSLTRLEGQDDYDDLLAALTINDEHHPDEAVPSVDMEHNDLAGPTGVADDRQESSSGSGEDTNHRSGNRAPESTSHQLTPLHIDTDPADNDGATSAQDEEDEEMEAGSEDGELIAAQLLVLTLDEVPVSLGALIKLVVSRLRSPIPMREVRLTADYFTKYMPYDIEQLRRYVLVTEVAPIRLYGESAF